MSDITAYSYYLTLFEEDRKPHIRQFAAESFSFLMRKVPTDAFADLVDSMLAHLGTHQSDAFVDALGGLFFESIKGVCMACYCWSSAFWP